jgi:hypothetical protein
VNRSLDFSFHAWRGIGPDEEPDLFFWRWRLGFVTVTVSRVDVLRAYRKLKDAARDALALLNRDGEGR